MSPKKPARQNEKFKMKKKFRSDADDSVKQGRVEKRPAVKLRKEKQKKHKKSLTLKTNKTNKDVIQLKKK